MIFAQVSDGSADYFMSRGIVAERLTVCNKLGEFLAEGLQLRLCISQFLRRRYFLVVRVCSSFCSSADVE